MSNEEMEILYTMYESLMILHSRLSPCKDNLYQDICEKIMGLKMLINDNPDYNDLQVEEILKKLEDINNLLLKMNYRLSFRFIADPAGIQFKTKNEEHIQLLRDLSLSNQLEIHSKN
jgi:hypothetical protein